MNAATEQTNFSVPELKEGEIYAGAFIKPDGTGHHAIILPGDNDGADWQTQMDWAKSIGGDLPDRVEQAMFFKNLPKHFQEDWYWSNTRHASYESYAWFQDFDVGDQNSSLISFKLRARAVHRVAI